MKIKGIEVKDDAISRIEAVKSLMDWDEEPKDGDIAYTLSKLPPVKQENLEQSKINAFLDGAGQGILAGLKIHKGKWIDTEPDKDKWHKSNNPWKCSCCGHRAGKDKYKTYKFCPWCGADMRGENK